jgi:menaquinone-dependent protoporphyrinogen oxidase
MTRTLVAFASKHGSTEEVARAIGAQLGEAGHDVDIRDAAVVTNLDAYEGVVLGGSLYVGRLHPDAREFLRRHQAAFGGRPLAVFALGPRTLGAHEVADSRKQLDSALARLDLQPTLVTIFGGVVQPRKLRFPLNRIPQSDARDWSAIAAWTDQVAARFSDSRQAAPA